MKNYQLLLVLCRRHALTTMLSFLLCIFFTSTYAQKTDVTGFNLQQEKQKAIEKGVNSDEMDSYLKKRREYLKAQFDYKTKSIGTRNTKPPISFARKSGTTNCVGDFENGTVPPWSGWTGTSNGIADIVNDVTVYTSGIVSGRHTITNVGNDPIISSIPMVYNGNHSLRLGNSSSSSKTERVSQTVTVTGSCFSFWYALVFEDPNHPYNEQPFFMFRLKDTAGNVLDSFVREASQDTSFFSIQPGVTTDKVYRDWTEYTYNFGCEYLGQEVVIEFTTADCGYGAHFGYAYIDDVCFEDCCSNCDQLFRYPGTMSTYEILKYSHSTENYCCYDFQWIFDADIFACFPYGVKIYEEGNAGSPYVNYLADSSLVYCDKSFNVSLLDFCISKSDFNGQNKTIRIAFLNKAGDVICDTMKQVLEPCHSSSSGCGCDNLFKDPVFAQAPIVSSDTSLGNEYECCFRINPYTDPDKLNCPYYGIRIYKDSNAYNATYLDTLSSTPMGGWGNTYPDSLNFTFCLSIYQFNSGPITVRIEYLDSSGKAICSKIEEIDCEMSCCEGISIQTIKNSNDPLSCCFDITGFLGTCHETVVAELMQFDGFSWRVTGAQPTPGGNFYFGSLCQMLGSTGKYVVVFRDSAGEIVCQKQVDLYCPDCCRDIDAYMIPAPSPVGPHIDKCCWDFYYYPQSFIGCPSPYSWYLFGENDTVPPQFPWYLTSMGDSMGRYCTPPIYPVMPAPGTTVTVWYKLKKQLALYDVNGNLICIKILEDSCSRTYSSPTGGGGTPSELSVAPNPFSSVFTATMQLPAAMPVSISVLNSVGTPVYQNDYGMQAAGEFRTTIDLSGQPAGIYSISVNNGQATTQIVKQ